jgi:hypothetical protein
MNTLFEILNLAAGLIADLANLFQHAFPDSGSPLTLAFAVTVTYGSIPEALIAANRRWHGGIDDQFSNISNLYQTLQTHEKDWEVPSDMMTELATDRSEINRLIEQCRSNYASPADRAHRNAILKSTVGYCLLQVKIWSYAQFTSGNITAEDVHLLGFFLPGETGGNRERTEATDVVAQVKVKIITADIARVIIDQSATDNAAQVMHGWPFGVKHALIVITAADGKTEVVRLFTTKLHNDIKMPEGSHGCQFLIKASFLKHLDDEPRFGNQPTFSMPLTTEDLVATVDHQHHADFEETIREIERHRLEIEQLQQQLPPQKSK